MNGFAFTIALSLRAAPFHLHRTTNFYFDGLERATEPLFHSLYDDLSARYFEMPEDKIERLRCEFVVPANDGVKATFDRAKTLYVRVASEAAIVRRLSGYEDLLQQLGNALKTPWAAVPDERYRNYGRRFPYWVATMTPATPFHRGLMALREANRRTLRLVHDASQALIAILRSMIAELEFADLLAKPAPMPQSLILVQQNIDASTTVGQGASVRDSAVGRGAQRG